MMDMLQALKPFEAPLAFVVIALILYPLGRLSMWILWRMARSIANFLWGEVGVCNVDRALHPAPHLKPRCPNSGDS